jgi:tRNA pseudouridine38-40 synthase
MRRESASLLGKHDFASFRASGSSAKTTVREVKDASWSSKMMAGGELLEFWIAADGFLYKMVRLIVGTLLDIGRGHLKEGTVARLLGSPEPGGAGQCVPGKGLCLEKVSFS